MTLYKISIDMRNYASWKTYNANTMEPLLLDNLNPIEHKLFSNDVFTYNKGRTEIIHSTTRLHENIPAVLILEDNKTYGREKKSTDGQNKNNTHSTGKLLYKCIPDDSRIPIFLVPYQMKTMGFSKNFTNLYVTI